MFERFTERARRAVILAQEEARRLNQSVVEPDHLFLGVVREGDGVAVQALKALHVDLPLIRTYVEAACPAGSMGMTEEMKFAPATKRALEDALREARQFGSNYIGTEHLLLGVLQTQAPCAAKVRLAQDHISEDVVRDKVAFLTVTEPRKSLPRTLEDALNVLAERRQMIVLLKVHQGYSAVLLSNEDYGARILHLVEGNFEQRIRPREVEAPTLFVREHHNGATALDAVLSMLDALTAKDQRQGGEGA
jgi:ATP-dependent Clp protease ATP-binding subunit ClpA